MDSKCPHCRGDLNNIHKGCKRQIGELEMQVQSLSIRAAQAIDKAIGNEDSREQASNLMVELQQEKAKILMLEQKNEQLQDEMEDLSQKLFQEANEKVAQERRKVARLEEKVQTLLEQKEDQLNRFMQLEDILRKMG